jgi:hypothetical protein
MQTIEGMSIRSLHSRRFESADLVFDMAQGRSGRRVHDDEVLRPTRFEALGACDAVGTPNLGVGSVSMPDEHAVEAWIRRNEAARAEDRRRDLELSMSERLEEAVRLSRVAAELETNLRREPDVRTG